MTQFEAIKKFVASRGEPQMGMWIGMNDKASEAGTDASKFVWTDKTPAWAGAPWAANAPVGDSDGRAYDCVRVLYTTDKKYNLSNPLCESKHAYLCSSGNHTAPTVVTGSVAIGGITDPLGADGEVKPEVTIEIAAALEKTLLGGVIEITKIVATKMNRARGRQLADKYSLAVEYEATYKTTEHAQQAIKKTGEANAGSSLLSALKQAGDFFAKQSPTVTVTKAIDPVAEAQQCGAPPDGFLFRTGKNATTVCGTKCHSCFVTPCQARCNAKYGATSKSDCNGSPGTAGNACWCTGQFIHFNGNEGRWKNGGFWGGCNYWTKNPNGRMGECKAQCGPAGLNDDSKTQDATGAKVSKDETCRAGCEFAFEEPTTTQPPPTTTTAEPTTTTAPPTRCPGAAGSKSAPPVAATPADMGSVLQAAL